MSSTLSQLADRIRARQDLPPPTDRKALRKAAGVSLAEVGNAVGVTRQAVAYWESGERAPRDANVLAYLEVLRVLKEALNGDEHSPEMTPPAVADEKAASTTYRESAYPRDETGN